MRTWRVSVEGVLISRAAAAQAPRRLGLPRMQAVRSKASVCTSGHGTPPRVHFVVKTGPPWSRRVGGGIVAGEFHFRKGARPARPGSSRATRGSVRGAALSSMSRTVPVERPTPVCSGLCSDLLAQVSCFGSVAAAVVDRVSCLTVVGFHPACRRVRPFVFPYVMPKTRGGVLPLS